MYACLFNSWGGLELDTIISIEPTYVDIGKERVEGIAFFAAGNDRLDWFIPLEPSHRDNIMRSIAGIYPNLIDMSEFDAVSMDGDENIKPDEWAWYTGRPAKKGLMDRALDKLQLRG